MNVTDIAMRFHQKHDWQKVDDMLWDVFSYNIPDTWFIEEANNQMMELAAA